MTGWTALVPLKLNDASKSRLSPAASAEQRMGLIEAMAGHVLTALGQVAAIDRIVVLSAARPVWWDGDWSQDCGDGLNAALELWRAAEHPRRLLVIHGDLPLVEPAEIETLLLASHDTGAALATDRAGSGTNALALADRPDFTFRFGPDSRARHQAAGACKVVELPGLSRDIDHPADLAEWKRDQSM